MTSEFMTFRKAVSCGSHCEITENELVKIVSLSCGTDLGLLNFTNVLNKDPKCLLDLDYK